MPFQPGNPGRPAKDPRERFWAFVSTPDEGCWEWLGAKTWDGYGRFRLPDRTVRAHRFMWQLCYGSASADLELDHLCGNRGCVNPAHLEEVTRLENHRRGRQHGQRRITSYRRPRAA